MGENVLDGEVFSSAQLEPGLELKNVCYSLVCEDHFVQYFSLSLPPLHLEWYYTSFKIK